MSQATYDIDIGWTGTPLAPAFGGGAYDDVTADTKTISISRGRSSNMQHMDQGRSSIRLVDDSALYNPENSGSALVGKLVPMKAVRIRATFAAQTYGLHYGFINRIDYHASAREAIIETVDLFEVLNLARPTIAVMTNKTPDYIIGQILDAVGWTDLALRSLAASQDVIPSWEADGTAAALSLIQDILTVERGIFFINGSGLATYHTRGIHYANGSPVATLSTIRRGVHTSSEVDRIINGQSVTRTGGTIQTATDATSRTNYGNRDGGAINSAYLASDAVAEQLANFVVAMNKEPRGPARQIGLINASDALLTQQLSREIGDLVTVDDVEGTTNFNGRIQGIRHEIMVPGGLHQTEFSVQKVSLQQFTIGYSTIGGPDLIGW